MKIRNNRSVEQNTESLWKAFNDWEASLALPFLFFLHSFPRSHYLTSLISFFSFLFAFSFSFSLLSPASASALWVVSKGIAQFSMTSQIRNSQKECHLENIVTCRNVSSALYLCSVKLPYCLKTVSFLRVTQKFNIPSFISLFRICIKVM